jgi:hypothetical protein
MHSISASVSIAALPGWVSSISLARVIRVLLPSSFPSHHITSRMMIIEIA